MVRLAKIVEPKMTLVTVTTVPHNIYMLNAGGSERRPSQHHHYLYKQRTSMMWRRTLVVGLGLILVFWLLWALMAFYYGDRDYPEEQEQ